VRGAALLDEQFDHRLDVIFLSIDPYVTSVGLRRVFPIGETVPVVAVAPARPAFGVSSHVTVIPRNGHHCLSLREFRNREVGAAPVCQQAHCQEHLRTSHTLILAIIARETLAKERAA